MLTVEIDGNDGTGKTFLISELKRLFAFYDAGIDIKYNDRGILSKITLEDIWDNTNNIKDENIDLYDLCNFDKDTIYFLVDDTIEKCQEHIIARGDSIEEEYHTKEDLEKYRKRFLSIYDKCPNVNLIRKCGKDFSKELIHDIIIEILCFYTRKLNNDL